MMVNWPFSNHLTGRNSTPWWTLTALHKQSEFALYFRFWRISLSQSPDIYLKNIFVQVWVCWVVSCMQQEAMTVLW